MASHRSRGTNDLVPVRGPGPGLGLDATFESMLEILNGNVAKNKVVNVMGVVKDVQLPINCRGAGKYTLWSAPFSRFCFLPANPLDYKMTVKLRDEILEETCSSLTIHVFGPEASMPTFSASDVVVVRGVRVQSFNSGFSLLTTYSTSMCIFRADSLFSPSGPVTVAWPPGSKAAAPSARDIASARLMYESVNKGDAPDIITFNEKVAQSARVRDKFSTLGGVRADQFYDLLVRVVSEPHFLSPDVVMMWVSDYTENDNFEDHGGGSDLRPEKQAVGDDCGYLTKFGPSSKKSKKNAEPAAKWTGPTGRRSMLMCCFDQHAQYIKEHVKCNDWVTLRNVKIKFGRDHPNLEGLLHNDLYYGSPISVATIDLDDLDRETMDPRLLEAMRRNQAYDKQNKKDIKKRKALQDISNHGGSNKGDNCRKRRNQNRALKQKGKDDLPLTMRVNNAIITEFGGQPVTPLADILNPAIYTTTGPAAGEGASPQVASPAMRLPFVNVKFAAQVRVVDFMPKRLLDFAAKRWQTDYERLEIDQSQDSASSCSSASSDDDGEGDVNQGRLVWEWRFAVLLEDATATTAAPTSTSTSTSASASTSTSTSTSQPPPARIWAVVDNDSGQLLTRLDACDLRKNNGTLKALREKMFLMWGNLEEIKVTAERETLKAQVAEQKAAEKRRQEEAAAAAAAAEAVRRQEAAAKKRAQRQEAIAANKAQKERARQQAAQEGDMMHYLPPESSDEEAEDEDGEDQGSIDNQVSEDVRRAAQAEQQPQPEKQQPPAPAPKEVPKLSNRPFVCCIQQYGVWGRLGDENGKTDNTNKNDKNDQKASHGPDEAENIDIDNDDDEEDQPTKRGWQQMFGIFGTSIKG